MCVERNGTYDDDRIRCLCMFVSSPDAWLTCVGQMKYMLSQSQ